MPPLSLFPQLPPAFCHSYEIFAFRHLSLEPQSIFFLFNLRNRFFRCMIYLQFEITVLYLSYGSLLFKNCPMFYGLLLMLHVLSESFCA